MIVAAAFVLVLGIAAIATTTAWFTRGTVLKARERHQVLVTLKNGDVFGGVLWQQDARAWVLKDATAYGAGENGDNLPLDGEVIILTTDIQYIQKP